MYPSSWRRGLLVAVVFLIGVLVVWLRSGNRLTVPSTTPGPLDVASSSSSPPPSQATPVPKMSNEKRIAMVDGLIEGTNQPINFWGKVVDQNGRPIEGVTVRYSYHVEQGNFVGSAWGVAKERRNTVATQTDGTFAIVNLQGHWLTILTLEKTGFRHPNKFGYTGKGEVSFNYDRVEPTHFTPDKNNPVVFPMIQEAAVEPLIAHGATFYEHALLYNLPADGTPVSWDLWRGRRDPAGELKLKFKREPVALVAGQKPARWEASLEVAGGGIMEEPKGQKTFVAPESEYAGTVDYPSRQQEQGRPDQRFYFQTAQHNYGRIEIELRPDDEGSSGRCLLTVYLNPQPGSRNLEYDKTKRQKVAAAAP